MVAGSVEQTLLLWRCLVSCCLTGCHETNPVAMVINLGLALRSFRHVDAQVLRPALYAEV